MQEIDGPMVRAFCVLEMLSEECHARLKLDGVVSKDGTPNPFLAEYRALRRAQLSVAAALGLTPSARTQMEATATAAAIESIPTDKIMRALKRDEPAQESGDGNSDSGTS